MTSRERVQTLLSGRLPDRPPLYDVIRNDAVLEHFGKSKLAPENAKQTVIDAANCVNEGQMPVLPL